MSIACTFFSHTDAEKAGWFSRRHQTAEAHHAAKDAWFSRQAAKAERVKAQQTRTAERKGRVS